LKLSLLGAPRVKGNTADETPPTGKNYYLTSVPARKRSLSDATYIG
jgi:hypothetical protein